MEFLVRYICEVNCGFDRERSFDYRELNNNLLMKTLYKIKKLLFSFYDKSLFYLWEFLKAGKASNFCRNFSTSYRIYYVFFKLLSFNITKHNIL